jgi:replication-associated recombination protein RarA
MQKSIRRGLERDALYAATVLEADGYLDTCLNRLLVTCHEDIGAADPITVMYARACFEDVRKWYPKGAWRLPFVNAIMAMCRAMKSRDGDNVQVAVLKEIAVGDPRIIPDYVFDKHTLIGKRMGRMEVFFHQNERLEPDYSTVQYRDEAYAAWLEEEAQDISYEALAKKKIRGDDPPGKAVKPDQTTF